MNNDLKRKRMYERIIDSLHNYADFIEIFEEHKNKKKVISYNKTIYKIIDENDDGISVRLIRNHKVISIHTSKIEENNVTQLIDELKKGLSKTHNLSKGIILTELFSDSNSDKPLKKNLIDYNEVIEKVYEGAKSIPLISDVNIDYREDYRMTYIANSKGIYKKNITLKTRAFIKSTAFNGIKKEFGEFNPSIYYKNIKKTDLFEYGKKASLLALFKLEADEGFSGEYPVIMGNGYGAVILHEVCGHMLEANAIINGNSYFSNKIGTNVASNIVTLIDDGTMEGQWGTSLYDDEGHETKRTILIENGILKNYLLDWESAQILNREITGNARRQSFRENPTARMTNTFLKPRSDTFEDMINDIEIGFYAKSMSGGYANQENGDFSCMVEEGYIIRKGEITTPIKNAIIYGNGLDILKNIIAIGSDLEMVPGNCTASSGLIQVSVGQPTIKISKMKIGVMNNDR